MGIFGGLYIFSCLFLGMTLTILLDQKIRGAGILWPNFLYPLALSFIVTGTAWKLFLDQRIGLERAVRDWGWTRFDFDCVVTPSKMIYRVAIAGIWQTCGFSMTTRVVIYGLLLLFALIYLIPLVAMLLTSLKPPSEVTVGNMFEPPKQLTLDPWIKAWGEARIGVSDTAGIKGYCFNSIKLVVPAVLISTRLGALNGYVLTK